MIQGSEGTNDKVNGWLRKWVDEWLLTPSPPEPRRARLPPGADGSPGPRFLLGQVAEAPSAHQNSRSRKDSQCPPCILWLVQAVLAGWPRRHSSSLQEPSSRCQPGAALQPGPPRSGQLCALLPAHCCCNILAVNRRHQGTGGLKRFRSFS